MTNKWQQQTVSDQFNVTNGSTNTDDAVLGGQFPLFDRSVTIKLSDKFLFDMEAVIIPGEGKEFIPRYYRGKFDLHQRAYAIFPKSNDESVDVKFLFYWMDFNKSYLTKMAVGSTVKSLRMYMLEKFPLVIPSKPIQQKVVDLFTSLDEAILKTDQIIQKTEELKNGLMTELLTKGIGHKKFKKTKLGEIPEQWNLQPLSELCLKIVDGVHKKPDYFSIGIPFITVKNLTAGQGISFDDVNYVSESDHKEFIKRANPSRGDVLVTKDGTLGIARVIDTDVPFSIFVSVALLKPLAEKLDSYYLRYAIESPILTEQFLTSGSGSALRHIHLVDFRRTLLPLPPIEEQRKIAEILAEVDIRLDKELKQKESFIKLKNGLMQDIFSQKVNIN